MKVLPLDQSLPIRYIVRDGPVSVAVGGHTPGQAALWAKRSTEILQRARQIPAAQWAAVLGSISFLQRNSRTVWGQSVSLYSGNAAQQSTRQEIRVKIPRLVCEDREGAELVALRLKCPRAADPTFLLAQQLGPLEVTPNSFSTIERSARWKRSRPRGHS
jgi:hypothetical protein